MFKRFITSLFCLFLIFVSMPFFYDSAFADDEISVPAGYSPCGLNDQVDAFKAYCKSRNLAIEGSMLDSATYTTSFLYQHAVKGLGLDINELQNQIYKRTSGNIGAQWFFTQTGITAMNRIFAEILQNNDMQVGETYDHKEYYSGRYFTDNQGNSCLVYEVNTSSRFDVGGGFADWVTKGSPYLHDSAFYKANSSNFSESYGFKSINYTLNFTYNATNVYRATYVKSNQMSSEQEIYYRSSYETLYDTCVIFNKYNNTLWIGKTMVSNRGSATKQCNALVSLNVTQQDINEQAPATTVYFTTNNNYNNTNNIINNNNYEGDTYITNEGDIVTNEPAPTPGGQDPGWEVGGGQGSYNDGQGNNYTINFPDFELPDLNIDWTIQGLGSKFPFSIPFDIANLVTVLNAEPEAPRFEGTVNFGFTTWDYDINLEQFDSVAHACRIAELLLLVFGLILITRSIIKG